MFLFIGVLRVAFVVCLFRWFRCVCVCFLLCVSFSVLLVRVLCVFFCLIVCACCCLLVCLLFWLFGRVFFKLL